MSNGFKFDEIGQWSEIKLEIVEKYGTAYVNAFANAKGLRKFYIDAFSGAGKHISKATGQEVEGSRARALRIQPSFDRFFFIDMDPAKVSYLRGLCDRRSDVEIHEGDCSPYLTGTLFPKVQYHLYTRALCLLDPYGLHLDWGVMEQAGHSKAIDLFLNFPVMDMNRNAIWRQPEKATPEGIDRMNRFWGDESWRQVAYLQSAPDLFGDTTIVKQPNAAIVTAFQKRLRTVAGFEFVPEPLPMPHNKEVCAKVGTTQGKHRHPTRARRRQQMSKILLSAFANRIRDKRRISFSDVQRLRRDILPDGIGCREEAELLVALDRHVVRTDSVWGDFLVAALVDFVVWSERPTGIVDADTARWLAAALADNGVPSTRTARVIVREIVEEAQALENDHLTALAASLARRKPRRAGPDRGPACLAA